MNEKERYYIVIILIIGILTNIIIKNITKLEIYKDVIFQNENVNEAKESNKPVSSNNKNLDALKIKNLINAEKNELNEDEKKIESDVQMVQIGRKIDTNQSSNNDNTNRSIRMIKTGSVKKSKTDILEQTVFAAGPSPNILENGEIINILFLGMDRTVDRDKTLGVYRTDTNFLANINLDTKKIQILCIPRDTYVYIPIIDKYDKINHAYVWGGMGKKGIQSTMDTVNRFIKYDKIDYYFAIDMEPIPDIVDDIGGVDLDVEIDMKNHGANLSKGFQHLYGESSYQYIHWRYSGDGDIGRIKRQQRFVKAMYSKLKDSKQLVEAVELVFKYNKYIKTNMNPIKLISIAKIAADIEKEDVSYYMVPGNFKNINKISYWSISEKQLDSILKEIFSR